MQIDAKDYLRLVELANTLAFVDLEASGLKADYNSVLVVSILPYQAKEATSFAVTQPGNDQKIIREVASEMEKYDCWVSYFGKGFDIPMLNTRLTKWGRNPLPSRHHIDLYFTLKYHLLTARKSQAHLLRFLNCDMQKMDLSPDFWNEVLADPKKNLPKMIARCESDTKGLRSLYEKTKHLIREIKKG